MQQQLSAGKLQTKAFTIVEIMTVVVISALLITAAIPGYENFMRNNESIIMASRLESSLQLARAEAIKQGIPVTVCPIDPAFNPTADFNQTSEQFPCQNSTDWTAWKVFADPNFNATEDFSNGWPIIQYVGDNQPSVISANISGPITFDPMGFANIQPATTRSGWTWSSSYSSGEWQWSYAYGSDYTGSYYRLFTIAPTGCSGNNARTVQISQNGAITILNSSC
jgi:type IV fimbrial biogenesis protein FimT